MLTTIDKNYHGLPSIISPFFAKILEVSSSFLPWVDTISPWFKKESVTEIDWFKRPPGLFLKSNISP